MLTKRITYWGINLGFFALCYWGFIEGVALAKSMALIVAWVTICLSPFAFLEDMISVLQNELTVPRWVDITYDTLMVVFLIQFGAPITGWFYLGHVIICQEAYKRAQTLK